MEYTVHDSCELAEALDIPGAKRIIMKKGDYPIKDTLILTDDTEIIGENGVNIYGSKRIYLNEIKPVGGIYRIKLSDYGINNVPAFGRGPFRDFWSDYDIPKPHMDDLGPSLELYFGKKKMNLSRYPRKGFTTIEKCLDVPEGENNPEINATFVPTDRTVFEENSTDDMLLVGYWKYDWATQRHTVKSYDKKSGAVTVDTPYHSYGYSAESGIFYILNVKTELKKPGDWYIDMAGGELWLMPYKNQSYVDVTVCENIFECSGAKNIRIENLNISRCRKSAIRFDKCENVSVENCRISNVGAWGIIADNCTDSRFSGCNISHTGGGGITCSGGDRNNLTPSGNIVCDNTISNIAYWHKTYLAAIEINGVGTRVSFNKIFDVPHFGIVFQGNNHIIENNDIGNACYESNDAGAIYAGRDYTCRGNVIRYNYLHDMTGYAGKGCAGVYFDDGMCSAEVYGNTFANFPNAPAAILLGGGRDFNIHNNYFYNCDVAISFDNRMEIWETGNAKQLKHLNEVPYRSEIWKKSYPELYNILEDEPKVPKNNSFCDNIVIGGVGAAVWREKAIEKHLRRSGNIHIESAIPSSREVVIIDINSSADGD